MPEYVNGLLASTDGLITIPGEEGLWLLDWQTPAAAIVTDTSFQLGALGIMYDSAIGESEWSTDFVDMPMKDESEAAQFQAFLSDVSVDSLMGSWLEVGSIAGWLYGDDVPYYNTTTITADNFSLIFPGLPEKYGYDSVIDIYAKVTDLHSFTSSAADQDVSVYGSVTLQFWPRFNDTTELAVELDVIDILFTGGIDITNFIATGKVSTFLVDKIQIPVSTIGDISALQLKVEFNTAMRVAVPIINKYIQKYQIPLPTDILNIFTLSDLYLKYADGYIFAGATPTFIAPTKGDDDGHCNPYCDPDLCKNGCGDINADDDPCDPCTD